MRNERGGGKMDRVVGGVVGGDAGNRLQVTAGDFHQIIRYSASGFCLVDKCHEAKNSHEHTSWRR